jgi:hypothetical protein
MSVQQVSKIRIRKIRVEDVPGEQQQPPRRGWKLGVAFLLVAGLLVFCHGCHGDEDNELFAWLRSVFQF